MDLLTSCREKLEHFGLKELKDVLIHFGLAKQGNKQDLVNRILALLSDDQVAKSHLCEKRIFLGKEDVAKLIEDTYRRMQHSSDFSHVKPEEEADGCYQVEKKVRCPCGNSSKSDDMVQCVDPQCHVWQHIACVIIPEKPVEGVLPSIPHFYCEICRINRADPFWVTMRHQVFPLKTIDIINDITNEIHTTQTMFQLSRADREILQNPEYGIQVWCLLLNDKVPFRMQWPQHAELQVNGVPVRVTNREPSQLLGINGRDDGPMITTCTWEGINNIYLSSCDARIFCFGIRLAKRRTVQEVLSLIPKEADGESFEDALARIRRCIGGEADTDNAGSDSDLEVVADSVTVSIRCPMSGSRIRIAGRFKPCVHVGCFDLEIFVELNQHSRKWQCPICLKNFSLENIIIDPYFNRITSMMQNCRVDVNEIDVKLDGSWRAKNVESGDFSKWHWPDGSLCQEVADVKPNIEKLKQIKKDVNSEGNIGLKIGMKRSRNEVWEISRPEHMKVQSLGNHFVEKSEDHYQSIVPMSSNATGSYRDGEDPSVNHEVVGNIELSINNSYRLDSFSFNFDPAYNIDDRIPPAPSKDQDVIVLSDSDDDNLSFIPSEIACENGTAFGNMIHLTNHAGVSERYPDMEANGLGLFGNTDDFGIPMWPTQNQTGPDFQIFGSETDIPDGLFNSNASLGCGLTTDCGLTALDYVDDNSHAQSISTWHPNIEMNDSLVENPVAFANVDPSLQIFPPSQPAGLLQADFNDHVELTNDWISFGYAAGGPSESAPSEGGSSRQQCLPNQSRIERPDEDDPLLFRRNDNGATM